MPTASAIRAKVKVRAGLPTTDTKSDDLILELINSAYHDLEMDVHGDGRHWSWLQVAFSFELAPNVWQYPVSATGAYNVRPGSLRHLRLPEVANYIVPGDGSAILREDPDLENSGDPTRFWMQGLDGNENDALVICFWPVPSTRRLVRGTYTRYLADLAVADTPKIPAAYHPIIIDLATWYFTTELKLAQAPIYQERAMKAIEVMHRDDSNMEDRILVAGGGHGVGVSQLFPAIGFNPAAEEGE